MKKIRKAKLADVVHMQRLINKLADKGELLHRSLNELYENIRDYYVAESENGEICGCCALHVSWENLAEIKSLVVAENLHRQGLGTKLLEACIQEARELGVPKVFALSYKPLFFEKNGFRRIDKAELPHKVWNECINCPKFPDCGEEALARDL